MSTATTAGRISQVIGSTFDAEFPADKLPAIYNAVNVKSQHKGVDINLVGEVQQHLGGSKVRCVALGSTDGVMRGQECIDTGGPLTVPVGARVWFMSKHSLLADTGFGFTRYKMSAHVDTGRLHDGTWTRFGTPLVAHLGVGYGYRRAAQAGPRF